MPGICPRCSQEPKSLIRKNSKNDACLHGGFCYFVGKLRRKIYCIGMKRKIMVSLKYNDGRIIVDLS
jgi:hypothetical protein